MRDQARTCEDGAVGEVMKTYREWKVSDDREWFRSRWPFVKKILSYAWDKDNPDQWDLRKSGLITGRQHHTLDMELFGPTAWLTSHYLGALKVASEMGMTCRGQDQAMSGFCWTRSCFTPVIA